MKKTLIAIVALFSVSAFATGYTPPVDPPSTPSNTTVLGTQDQNSINTASGVGTGVGTGVGVGGAATGGSAVSGSSSSHAITGPSYAANGDQTSNYSSKYLSLPQPVWTQVPTAFGCIVTSSKAGALGWNFVSGSSTTQQSEVVCTTVRMAEAATAWCQYETAAFLNKRAYEQMYSGENGDFFLKGGKRDLTFEECEATKRPVMIMERQLAAPPSVEQNVRIEAACPAPIPAAHKHSAPRKYTPIPKTTCK